MGPFEKSVEEHFLPEDAFSERFPRMYVQCLAEMEGVSLHEAARRSLSRVLRTFLGLERNAAMITAFRVDLYDTSTNRQRNRVLAQDLRAKGWGFTPVIGGWEQEETGLAVEEETFVVSAPPALERKQFAAELLKLTRKYDQDGALIKFAGDPGVYLLSYSGTLTKVGSSWQFDKLAKYYTKMRSGSQRGRKFRFECAGSNSVAARRMVYEHFKAKHDY